VVGLSDVRAARVRLAGLVPASPCISWHLPVNGGPELPAVHLKCENLMPTGSFKVRGATNAVALLAQSGGASGVVTASSGNHGQAVAFAARRVGISATVVVPEDAAAPKVEGARALGAEVVTAGLTSGARIDRAQALARERGMPYISSFDHEAVIAGQGTIGLELLAQVSGLRRVLVPIGGGGLIGGISLALKEIGSGVRVIGVEPEGSACALAARRAGGPVSLEAPRTIADGLRTTRVGELTWPLIERYVDDIVTVPEDAIRRATAALARFAHLVAEPSGAVTTAALLCGAVAVEPGTACVVSGGNIDPALLAELLAAA
jgi:threonine dehydratase